MLRGFLQNNAVLLIITVVLCLVTRIGLAKDLTATYHELAKQREILSSEQLNQLRQMHVLLIPGILAELFINEHRNKTWVSLIPFSGEYFCDILDYFNDENILAERLNTIRSVEPAVNSMFIKQAIENLTKPTIIIAHSKGGVDLLTALVDMYESKNKHLNKVKGVIFLQSPLRGSLVADKIASNGFKLAFADFIIRACGGNKEAILEVRTSVREQFNSEHHKTLMALPKQIAIIVVGTYKDDTPGVDTNYELSRNYLNILGKRNDGLIVLEQAFLSEFDSIMLENVDHSQTVVKAHDFDQIQMIKTLMALVLR